jgi:hypothetical protein
MEGVFSRSWKLTQLSFSVIREDKELLIFPFLSAFFSLAVLAAFWMPLHTFWSQSGSSQHSPLLQWGLLFLLYFALNFCATFFSVCAVHIVKKRLEGGKEPLSESFAFAFSRVHLIASWSLVAATVSVLLRMLKSLAGNRKSANPLNLVAGLLMSLVLAGLKISWTIVTLFVVPAMVYKDLGPLDAIKDSTQAIKKTWGESLARHYGLGLVEFLVLLGGIVVFGGLGLVLGSASQQTAVILTLASFLVAYVVVVVMVFSTANTVYNTALYAYASTGQIPEGYSKDVLENAFRPKP